MAHRLMKTGVFGRGTSHGVRFPAAAVTCLALLACAPMQQEENPAPLASQQPPPPWAFMVQPPVQPPPDDGVPRHVPGSTVAFSVTQIRDLFVVPDWHPGDHPPLPGVVGVGRKPDLFACGYCHYPNGLGRPENASVAGLSAGYIAQQIADFRNGLRKSSQPALRAVELMVANAKKATDEDVKVAAGYFAGLKYQPWVRVVETQTVPKTQVAGFMLAAVEGAGTEPIGQRIIELAQDVSRTNVRDTRAGFIAYVPLGSIKRGEALVTEGGRGRTVACGSCHGPDLKGMGDVPPLAGRSPTYVVRQLYDFQSGARAGLSSPQMKPTVERLTLDDMVAIAAYTASRSP
jgi:cytochrome c553